MAYLHKTHVASVFLIAGIIIPVVDGFGFGAPHSVCGNNVPHHDSPPTWTPSPYKVTVDKLSYDPNDIITVNITSDIELPFLGFQIRANRLSGNIHEIVGSYIEIPENCKKQIWYSATNESNCVTHSNNKPRTSVVLKWKAPDKSIGDIVFSSGVVQNFDNFWVDVRSPVVKATTLPEPGHVETIGDFLPEFFTSDCGSRKGCIMWPRTCSGADCRYVITYKTVGNGQYVDIEMKGETDGYLAIGFSYDLKMGHDETYLCGSTKDFHGIQHGYSPHLYNVVHTLEEMSHMQMKRDGHVLYCRFRRPIRTRIITPDGYNWPPKYFNTTYFDLNDDFYVQVAFGYMYLGTPSAHKHDVLPLVTKSKVDFQSKSIVRAQLLNAELQAHAILSVTAWLLLVGFLKAITSTREGLMAKKVCGVAAWFQIHRAVAVLAALCTAASIIIIFVSLKAITLYDFAHAVIGLVVTGMVLLQILLGVLRPKMDAKARPLWRFFHYILGNLTHVLAGVTMLLGVQSILFDAHFRYVLTIIIGSWMGFQVIFEFIFAKVRANALQGQLGQKDKEIDAFRSNIQLETKSGSSEGSGPNVLVALYVLMMLAFYAATLYYISSL